MLEDVAAIICGACKGKCCTHFPVYQFDKEHGIMFKNPTYYDGERNGRNYATVLMNYRCTTDNHCYFFDHGGCKEEDKDKLCKNWFCNIFDEFVLGEMRAIIIGMEAKWVTRRLMEVLK